MLLKKLSLAFILTALSVIPSISLSAPYVIRGTVKMIETSDFQRYGSADSTGFYLLGANDKAGKCNTFSGNPGSDPLFLFRDDKGGDRMLALVSTAMALGKVVEVRVDDDTKYVNAQGYCFVSTIYILN